MRSFFAGKYHLLSDTYDEDDSSPESLKSRESRERYKSSVRFWKTCSIVQSIAILLGLILYYCQYITDHRGVPKQLLYCELPKTYLETSGLTPIIKLPQEMWLSSTCESSTAGFMATTPPTRDSRRKLIKHGRTYTKVSEILSNHGIGLTNAS